MPSRLRIHLRHLPVAIVGPVVPPRASLGRLVRVWEPRVSYAPNRDPRSLHAASWRPAARCILYEVTGPRAPRVISIAYVAWLHVGYQSKRTALKHASQRIADHYARQLPAITTIP
jgi:hypothetical protein